MSILNDKSILNITGEILNFEKQKEALCNEVYFVNAKNGKFIIKVANGDIRQHELEKEYNIINKLKNEISLPQIYLYVKRLKYSYFVMQYIDGEKPKTFTNDILKKLAVTLRNIHSNIDKSNQFVDFDNLLVIAEQNMKNGRLDLDEFVRDDKFIEPNEVLLYLKSNKPQVQGCLLHGDYRPKNMILNNRDLFVLDWGLSFVGDPYYDLAIIKWYFSDKEFEKFLEYYGIVNLDKERLNYNEWLSAFLNV